MSDHSTTSSCSSFKIPPTFTQPLKNYDKSNGEYHRKSLRAPVTSSMTLKIPLNNRRKTVRADYLSQILTTCNLSGLQQDHKLRLAMEESRLHRLRKLHRAKIRRVAAEHCHCKKQGDEMQLLMSITEKKPNATSLDPHLALTLARAARDVLIAEEGVARHHVKECLRMLDTLNDAADEAHACVQDANHQIGTILNMFEQQGIRVNLSSTHSKPSFLIRSKSPGSSSDDTPSLVDTDSDSDMNSSDF